MSPTPPATPTPPSTYQPAAGAGNSIWEQPSSPPSTPAEPPASPAATAPSCQPLSHPSPSAASAPTTPGSTPTIQLREAAASTTTSSPHTSVQRPCEVEMRRQPAAGYRRAEDTHARCWTGGPLTSASPESYGADVVDGWINEVGNATDGYRTTLMASNITSIGIGVAIRDTGSTTAVARAR